MLRFVFLRILLKNIGCAIVFPQRAQWSDEQLSAQWSAQQSVTLLGNCWLRHCLPLACSCAEPLSAQWSAHQSITFSGELLSLLYMYALLYTHNIIQQPEPHLGYSQRGCEMTRVILAQSTRKSENLRSNTENKKIGESQHATGEQKTISTAAAAVEAAAAIAAADAAATAAKKNKKIGNTHHAIPSMQKGYLIQAEYLIVPDTNIARCHGTYHFPCHWYGLLHNESNFLLQLR